MLTLSKILLTHRELESFKGLVQRVKAYAADGEIFLEFDVRPPFADTPEDWEAQLEAAFTAAVNTTARRTTQ